MQIYVSGDGNSSIAVHDASSGRYLIDKGYRLYGEDQVAVNDDAINLNTATIDALCKGLSIKIPQAKAIIALRPIEDLSKLAEIEGLNVSTITTLVKV